MSYCNNDCCGKKDKANEENYPSVDQIANYRNTQQQLRNSEKSDSIQNHADGNFQSIQFY